MWPLGIVPHEPWYQFLVKGGRINQRTTVIINEFFLDGTIEPLTVRIHLGSPGIGVIVREMQLVEFFREVLHDFRAIISQHKHKGMRGYHQAVLKELFCRQ